MRSRKQASAAKASEEPSEDKSVYTAIRVPSALLNRARARAKAQRRSFANYLCILMEIDLGDVDPGEIEVSRVKPPPR